MNKITCKLNITPFLDLNRYVGAYLIYHYSYSSDVVPRVGELVSIANRDMKNLNDSLMSNENREHFFRFNEIFGDYEFNKQDYEVKSVKHSNEGLHTYTQIEIAPTQAVLSAWANSDVSEKITTALNSHIEYIKTLKEKEEEVKNKKSERRNKIRRFLSLGILK